MDRSNSLLRVEGASSGHLATVRPNGAPHVVVVTFAMVDGTVVTAIDHKPKTRNRLQRLINIEANPMVSFLVDHYEEEWEALWWVRIDGPASIHEDDDVRTKSVAALVAKYPQYRVRPPQGPVIAISPEKVSSWSYRD